MDKLWKILSVILIGVMPIMTSVSTIIFMVYQILGLYIDEQIFIKTIIENPYILATIIILSIREHYCIYHQISIGGIFLIMINSYLYDSYTSITIFNYTQYLLMVVTTFGLIMTFIHIIQQLNRHKRKFKILFYAVKNYTKETYYRIIRPR